MKIGDVRGDVLDGTPPVVVTAHPSSVVRLRGRGGFDEAFDILVADLRVAGRVAASA